MSLLPRKINEIQSLRAFSIISIILYHSDIYIFNKDLFRAGFLGVDVFLVISGYLIFKSLDTENITKNFWISLKNFYFKRVKRILPLLIIVIFFTNFFSIYLLSFYDYLKFYKSINSALFFYSNWFFETNNTVYGSEDASLKPLIHLWSLSVEMQIYALFPFIIYFCRYLNEKNILIGLLLFFFISLLYSEYLSRLNQSSNYYSSISRLWEFLSGAILAFLTGKNKLKFNNTHSNLLIIFGFSLLFFSLIYFNDKFRHPSFISMIPIFGSVIIILGLQNFKHALLSKILNLKPIILIGNISYSLFLWHWIIFTFLKLNLVQFNTIKIFPIVMLIVFLLSLFTFYLVEKPFWKNNTKRYLNYLIIFCFLFLNLKVHLIYNQFVKPKETALNLNSAPWDDLKNEKNEICYSKQKNFCTFQKENKKKIFIVGDSILGTLQSGLVERLKAEDYSVTIMTSNDCFYAPNFNYIYLSTNKTHPKCSHKYQQTRQEILKKQEKAIIILGGNLPVYLSNKFYFKNNKNNENKTYDKRFVNINNKRFYNDVQKSIKELSNNNYVILLYPVIEPGYNVPRYIESKLSKFSSKKELYQLSLKSIEKEKKILQRIAQSKKFFDGVKGKNIFRIYPQKIICKNSKCSFFNKDNIYYIDETHPSKVYANKINDKILEKIFKIFSKPN